MYLRVTNPFAGRFETSLDLHALSTSLAFILSQDQTLKKNSRSNSKKLNCSIVNVLSKNNRGDT